MLHDASVDDKLRLRNSARPFKSQSDALLGSPKAKSKAIDDKVKPLKTLAEFFGPAS